MLPCSRGCCTQAWFDHALWQQSVGGVPKASLVLSRGQAALPHCSLLRFAQADMEEGAGLVDKAQQVVEWGVAQGPVRG